MHSASSADAAKRAEVLRIAKDAVFRMATGASAVAVGVGLLPGAFEGDLILGYLAALLDGGGLGDAFRLDFVGLLNGLPRINLWMALDWGDHRGLL